jgi:tripartite-type tricarboxylate transporter receptor subunit TctC
MAPPSTIKEKRMGKGRENRKGAVAPSLIVPKIVRTLRRVPRGVNASNLPRRRFLRLAAGAAALPAIVPDANAQAYPTRPITMIVAGPPGGPTDAIGRVLAERMRRSLGQSIIIENVGGVGGAIGAGRVARARPDGYTIDLGFIGTHVLNGAMYSLQYDVLNDFAPVSPLASGPLVLFART